MAELSAEELAKIFFEYGEEPRSRAVARAIVQTRETEPIRTTGELRTLGATAIGGRRDEGRDPATRVFQALRIATNRELVELGRFLDDAIARLSLGARLAVLSYHSLEDRIVKHSLRRLAGACVCPPEAPECRCNPQQLVEILTSRAERPAADEVAANPRARSARLRVARRLGAEA